tara:strand:- start:33 stop:434 length:402 start_codon:yes stop_codon:yes gene_type:complete
MTTFGEVIEKAKDGDKNKIRGVMKWTLDKDEKDTITKPLIAIVQTKLDTLDYSNAANSNEMASIGRWADKYQTFINNATNVKGGKRKRRKRTRKRKRKRKKKGGFLLLGYAAYKMYNNATSKKKKKKRKRKTY